MLQQCGFGGFGFRRRKNNKDVTAQACLGTSSWHRIRAAPGLFFTTSWPWSLEEPRLRGFGEKLKAYIFRSLHRSFLGVGFRKAPLERDALPRCNWAVLELDRGYTCGQQLRAVRKTSYVVSVTAVRMLHKKSPEPYARLQQSKYLKTSPCLVSLAVIFEKARFTNLVRCVSW